MSTRSVETPTEAPATGEVAILGFRARITAARAIVDAVRESFPPAPPWSTPVEAALAVEFQAVADTPGPGWSQILSGGVPMWTLAEREEVLPALEWLVTATAIDHLARHYVLFHAGAVVRGGRAVVLPAGSGSGKTTLIAGLLAVGFQYLSDEVTVVERGTFHVLPFARSLCIKDGSRDVLTALFPQLASSARRRRFGEEPVSYLPPPAGAWATEPAPVREVVFPHYRAGAETTLEPLSQTDAIARLLPQSFNIRALGAEGVRAAIDMLAGTRCYALTMGDLSAAVRVMDELTR